MIASDCVNAWSPSTSVGTSRVAETAAYDSLNCSFFVRWTDW